MLRSPLISSPPYSVPRRFTGHTQSGIRLVWLQCLLILPGPHCGRPTPSLWPQAAAPDTATGAGAPRGPKRWKSQGALVLDYLDDEMEAGETD